MDHLGSNPVFSDILLNKKILTIHTQEASLEDIFIKVTGTHLKQ
jgi:fluoroquinolone transport system ATP-binding protein